MSYREPIERKKRLWFVSLAYVTKSMNAVSHQWVWAFEGHLAVEAAIKVCSNAKNDHAPQSGSRDDFWSWEAVCAEDFIEREAKGPPVEKTTPPQKAT